MDDDDDLTPWNPAHFGHTDFQKESDGQLTIFFEDAHEPPDLDDFASVEAYEIAWTEWEQTQTLPQEDKQMTGKFEATAIEQITYNEEQLAKLRLQKEFFVTSELSPDKILALVIASVAKMEELEVEGDWIGDWGEDIYKVIFGTTSEEEFKARFAKQLTSFESQKKIELSYRDSLTNLQAVNNKLVESVAELTKELTSEKRKVLELSGNTTTGNSEPTITDEIEYLKKEVERWKLGYASKDAAIDEVRDAWTEKENQWCKEREELETKVELLESRYESDRVVDIDKIIQERDEVIAERDNSSKDYEELAKAHAHLKDVIMDEWRTEINKIKIERDTALEKITDLTAASLRVSDELNGVRASLAIANQESFAAKKELADLTMQKIGGDVDNSIIEGYKKTITELTIANQNLTEEVLKLRGESRFKQIFEEVKVVGGIGIERDEVVEAKFAIGDIVEHEDGRVGEVIYVPETSAGVISVRMPNCNESLHTSSLKLISRGETPKADQEVQKPQETPTFELNDHVQVIQVEDDKDLLHRNGVIAGILGNQVSVLFRKTDEFEEYETILSADCLKILPGNSEIKTQEIISEFLRKLDRISRVDKLDWAKIKELPLNLETMRELGLQIKPKSKTHGYLMTKMPAMCAGYISETGDKSDLEWLPKHFVEKVEYLLEMGSRGSAGNTESEPTGEAEEESKKSTSPSDDSGINPGDTVIMCNEESPYLNQQGYVLDSRNGWLNVKDPDGTTDMWKISDVELVADSAA